MNWPTFSDAEVQKFLENSIEEVREGFFTDPSCTSFREDFDHNCTDYIFWEQWDFECTNHDSTIPLIDLPRKCYEHEATLKEKELLKAFLRHLLCRKITKTFADLL